MKERASGILLHVTSLPSRFGIGDLGPSALQFVDFLVESGQSLWQILPLNPTGTYLGNSPYTSYSAFAGNPLLISLDVLLTGKLLAQSDLSNAPLFSDGPVDYKTAIKYKGGILRSLFQRHKDDLRHDRSFTDFCDRNSEWLDDYALFVALKERFDEVLWQEWPPEIRDRESGTIRKLKQEMDERIRMAQFYQYLFWSQWSDLKQYCSKKGIQIIGDIPIYTSIDSADVWAHPEMYDLDGNRMPRFVAGAPPDYFSATGQRWGNPVYRWEFFSATNYDWWMNRIRHNLKLFDIVRLDHFRGFVAYWQIPAEEETAVKGRWVTAPAMDFFRAIVREFPSIPIIVEDLGFITQDVRDVMDHFQFPGMKVLLFAFGSDPATNPYLPHNYKRNCVVYTGTHDNNTIRGWYESEAGPVEHQNLADYLGRVVGADEIHWEIVRMALGSVANTAVIPMQDVLGLGGEARMNLPSRSHGNWSWRLTPEHLTTNVADQLRRLTRIYGRLRLK